MITIDNDRKQVIEASLNFIKQHQQLAVISNPVENSAEISTVEVNLKHGEPA